MNIIVFKNKSFQNCGVSIFYFKKICSCCEVERSFSDISVNIRKSCIAACIRKSTVSLFRYVVGEGISPLKINAREKRGKRGSSPPKLHVRCRAPSNLNE